MFVMFTGVPSPVNASKAFTCAQSQSLVELQWWHRATATNCTQVVA